MRHFPMATVLGVAILAAGCGKKPAVETPAPVAEEPAPRPSADRGDDEAVRRAAEEARRREEQERRNREVLQERVFFDFDVSDLRPDARAILDRKVPVLRDNAGIRIRIEGHADDRGSSEYNLALGNRRAESIRAYLTDFGLASSRFEIVSYGEERPLVQGSGETSWAQNRRGEFVIQGSAGVVTESGR